MKVYRVYWESYERDIYGSYNRVNDKAKYFFNKEDAEEFLKEGIYHEKEARLYHKGCDWYSVIGIGSIEHFSKFDDTDRIEIVELEKNYYTMEEIEIN